jgi:large subunit ribosomal protein L4
MQVDVKDLKGKALRKVDLPADVYGVELNDNLLYLVVKGYQANRRQGTHWAKTRSFVSGGGKKPFKQKGTGGARQGTLRGPHMPGGATVHGPQPRCYRQKMSKKTRQEALRVAISDKAKNNRLVVIDDFGLSSYSTKHVVNLLGTLKVGSALLADERKDNFLSKSADNIYKVSALSAGDLNAEAVLRHETLVITEKALESLNKRLATEA